MDLVKQANNGYWENRNSRGIDTVAMYKKVLPADVFAKYEKVEAAHKNGMENLPLFIGAVVLGNMAKLSPSKSAEESKLSKICELTIDQIL